MKFHPDIPVYGDISYRGECPVENAEQITFFAELERRYPNLRKVAIHPRNEGKRSYQQAARHKVEGMTPGASDIIIPGCPSFVCELKRRDHTKSKWESGQVEYLEEAKRQGCFVCVALGWEGAMQALEDWL